MVSPIFFLVASAFSTNCFAVPFSIICFQFASDSSNSSAVAIDQILHEKIFSYITGELSLVHNTMQPGVTATFNQIMHWYMYFDAYAMWIRLTVLVST